MRITSDGTNLYVADGDNHKIRKIVISTGVVTTLAGIRKRPVLQTELATSASFNYPYGITVDRKQTTICLQIIAAITDSKNCLKDI